MLKYGFRFISIVLAICAFAACQAATPASAPTASVPTLAPNASIPTTAAPTAQATSAPTTGATSAATAPPTEAPTEAPTPTETLGPGFTDLILVTHDSFAASEDVIQEFEKANHARVQVLKSGDAGAALNKEILAGASNPLGDAFFGVDNTFLSRALKANIFDAYKPAGAEKIPAPYVLDSQFRLTPTDWGDVCVNYDLNWFKQKNIAPPQSLEDLTKPQYKSLFVEENPATSSPGLAFLLATIAHFGEDKYLDYWKQLRANEVFVTDGWEDAYYGQASWEGKGDKPIVVSYATDPAAEVYFSNGKYTEPPNATIHADGTCWRQVEFIGALKGAKHPELARKFIDYLLSVRFQEDIPSQMFVFPVNPQAKLPDFFKFAETPKQPAQLSADTIDANREKWINAWTQTVLR